MGGHIHEIPTPPTDPIGFIIGYRIVSQGKNVFFIGRYGSTHMDPFRLCISSTTRTGTLIIMNYRISTPFRNVTTSGAERDIITHSGGLPDGRDSKV
jgi:hypothetical protein